MMPPLYNFLCDEHKKGAFFKMETKATVEKIDSFIQSMALSQFKK